jgi:signal transduction histidine kinase/CheY-like chemotaxis protein
MQTQISTGFLSRFNFLPESEEFSEDVYLNAHPKLLYNIKAVRTYGIIILIANSLINYYFNYTYSFFVTSISAIILIATILFIKDKHFVLLRSIFILTYCITICYITYIEGLVSGDYLYLFVLLIISTFIFDYKERNLLFFSYAAILFCLLFIFTLAPLHSVIQRLGDKQERITFLGNIFCSSIITCLLAFVSLRQNFRNTKKLGEKQEFLDAVYNTSLDAVFIVNTHTKIITDSNLQSVHLFDVKDNTILLNKSIANYIKNFDAQLEVVKIFDNQEEAWKGELTCCTASGSEFPGYVSIVPFENGEQILKKISILDITDIKKVQAELVVAKDKAEFAMNAKSKFLSNMSHELRTPLNGIIGTANLLLDEASMPEQKEHFSLLKYSSEHMLNLINDVLDISKIEAEMMHLEKISFNLKTFFDKIQSLYTNQFAAKKIQLLFEIDERLDRYFLGDETRLSQVMSNLISNALKFTDNGNVIVSANLINANSKKASIYFSVKDLGLGITEQQQKIIFNSFTQADTTTTRKFGGTGLGLAISKNIIELYKGELKVESKKGSGSNFYFTIELDLQLNNKNFVNEHIVSTLVSLANVKVLIAEDNQINMLIARKFLQKWNITPAEALNGVEALEIFHKDNFDILLIDLEMPEKDGYETVAAIREIDKDIPVIAFTAAVYDNMHADLVSKGFTDYIQKPFRPEDLHRKLSQYASVKV